jgi:hypothetical protein
MTDTTTGAPMARDRRRSSTVNENDSDADKELAALGYVPVRQSVPSASFHPISEPIWTDNPVPNQGVQTGILDMELLFLRSLH